MDPSVKVIQDFKLVCGHYLVCGNFQRVNFSTEISAEIVLDFVLFADPLLKSMPGALAEMSVNYLHSLPISAARTTCTQEAY